ncbi:MAG: hypothetical protein U0934_02515 [Pseudotabrizicola sp.]|uniref:hypothetical protein n=1 Tax=Pseudotabrizicola sp. TaxID=2939647 RepID=UPI0027161C3C|nr:hypothetical protein [Pseudotabrizicola sp.]MDO8882212.1 hypothetical protein [Pseudotabrizicola sp.]MDP2082508.1 hypothetical protein [Pseudotabrizicola sp.]MDZ7572814.1 hypothetical protein [Pseudotabrizicola sp.]
MPGSAETVLQDLRKAVMDGQYAQLAVLMPALQDVEADFRSGDLVTLRSLQAEAERTEACLQSALSGVRAARRRVVEVAEAAKGLTTYDRVGHKATVPTVTPTSRRV